MALDPRRMAARAARELEDGMYVISASASPPWSPITFPTESASSSVLALDHSGLTLLKMALGVTLDQLRAKTEAGFHLGGALKAA